MPETAACPQAAEHRLMATCGACDHPPRPVPAAHVPDTSLPIRRLPLPEVVARAADILEEAMRGIDHDNGQVNSLSWSSLLAVMGILRAAAARAEVVAAGVET